MLFNKLWLWLFFTQNIFPKCFGLILCFFFFFFITPGQLLQVWYYSYFSPEKEYKLLENLLKISPSLILYTLILFQPSFLPSFLYFILLEVPHSLLNHRVDCPAATVARSYYSPYFVVPTMSYPVAIAGVLTVCENFKADQLQQDSDYQSFYVKNYM